MTTPASPIIGVSRIVLSIDAADVATFSELIGISSDVEPAAPPASPTGIVTTKQPFGTASQTVTLKRAVDGNSEIWAWHQAVLTGAPTALRTCALQLQNASGQVLLSFILEDAWPSKVDIAGPQGTAPVGAIAGQAQVMMETDEFVCSSIIMQPG